MKTGANFEDINQIKAGYAKGMSAEEISELLKIELKCVASFEPPKTRKKKAEA